MLSKHQRLSRPEFQAVFAAGRRQHTPLLTLIKQPEGAFRAAVVVSKKVAKKAHDRNRIRRRLYEVLGTLAASGAIQGTIIVHVKPPLGKLPKREFFTEVTRQIAQTQNSQ